jgi:hypothetical protein
MPPSNWNQYLDRLLAEKLTVAEHRLALALARHLLGWRRTHAPLGRALLREAAGLDGRAFDRAIAGLVAKGLVAATSEGPGRGKRTTYALILTPENAAPERPFPEAEKAAPARPKPASRKGRSHGEKRPPYSGHALIEAGVKASAQPPTDFIRHVFDTYTGAGGTVQLERERGALARNAKAALKAQATPEEILAAARSLGRNREFPGLLQQRITEIRETGGPCNWDNLDRSALTPSQLEECGCTRCAEWVEALRQPATAA